MRLVSRDNRDGLSRLRLTILREADTESLGDEGLRFLPQPTLSVALFGRDGNGLTVDLDTLRVRVNVPANEAGTIGAVDVDGDKLGFRHEGSGLDLHHVNTLATL